MSLHGDSILAVGTVAFDTIRTPFGSRERVVGGAGTYVGWASSRLVKQVGLVSVIGDDFPTEELKQMEAAGMNLDGVELRKGEKSFFWSGTYHMDLNTRDTLVTDLNVLADFKPVVPASMRCAPWVMLGNIDPNLQLSVLDQMEERPKLIVLDTMNYWMDSALEDLLAVIARVDVVTINDEEARQLSGQRSLVRAARYILDLGPKYLVIKKGEHGALLFQKSDGDGLEFFSAPALPLEEVVDPTGAGDTFAGGFLGHIARCGAVDFDTLKQAVVVGSALASFTCEAFGTERIRTVSEAELMDRVETLRQLVDCAPIAVPVV
jgi:sugar/nucleoside kinase (ribokinase family)